MNPRQNNSVFRRGISFIKRIRWMAPLACGIVNAVSIVLRIRRDPNAIQKVYYRDMPIRFRGQDEEVLKEIFIEREYAFLTDMLATGKELTVLDIGAHIGAFAIWVLDVNPSVRIVSLEADPNTCRIAELNAVELAHLDCCWEVLHGAAAEQDGVLLHLSDAGPSMSHRVGAMGSVDVEGITLRTLMDKVAPDNGSVDLVKIDIEGCEEEVLCSDPAVLERIAELVIELHPNLCDTHRVHQLLCTQYDYVQEVEGRRSQKPLLHCWRN